MTMLVILVILCLYHREKIFIWLYSNPRIRPLFLEDPVGKGLPYDIFISYVHEDAHFVEGTLVPGLEESCNIQYKCLVHVRDFMPGRNITEQVIEAVESSRKTLVCLSKNFVLSDWAKLEFELAHSRKRVVLVLVGDPPTRKEMGQLMHDYIKTNTYLDAIGDPWFWEKVRYALPHKDSQRVAIRTFLGMKIWRGLNSEQMGITNPSITRVVAHQHEYDGQATIKET